jgi:hypothetical protein
MKKKYVSLMMSGWSILSIIIILNPLAVYSADISGSWKAEFDTQIGPQKYTFTFTQSDTGISGTAVSDIGGEIHEVILTEIKLDSNKISFVENLPFQGMDLHISYDGIVTEKEMQLNRHVGDFAAEKLVAKREQDSE